MAFPQVYSSNNGNQASNATTHTVNLPPVVAVDQLLIVIFIVDDSATVTWDNSSHGTWTSLLNHDLFGRARCRIFYKVAAGTEGGGTLSITTGSSQRSCHYSAAIGDWTKATAPAISSIAENIAADIDPPSLNPSGWGTEDTLWGAVVFHEDGTYTVSAYPSSFSIGQANIRANDSDGVGLGISWRELNAASVDPSSYSLSPSSPQVGLAGFTLAVRPGTDGPPSSGTDYELDADSGSVAITGTAATLKAGRKITADAGAVSIAGTAADLVADRHLVAEAGAILIAGTDATLLVGRKLTADPGAIAIEGTDATLLVDRLLAAGAGSVLITGHDATLRKSAGMIPPITEYAPLAPDTEFITPQRNGSHRPVLAASSFAPPAPGRSFAPVPRSTTYAPGATP